MRLRGLLSRLLRPRASQQFEQVLREYMRGTQSATGIGITEESAMRAAAVYACVRVISETVASLPLHVYQRKDERSKVRAYSHPLYRLLHDRPNSWQTSFEFREMLQSHLCLRGRAFAYINRDTDGNVRELIPLHPDHVTVEQLPDYSLVYRVDRSHLRREPVVLGQSQILHLRGLSSDGVDGRSVIGDAREALGLALATQEYGARFFRNDATPGVVLVHPTRLSPEAQKRLEISWNEAHAGSGSARRTAVLEEGMKIERLSMTAEDAQFLETRKFSRSEIAGLFRVPPHMIGDLEKATFSNIEHQAIDFVVHCIRPWLVRWEQALSRDLFLAPVLYFAEFNVDGLLRGDIRSRYEAYAIGRQWGWLSRNDIREKENMNPIEGGDDYLTPLNMASGTSQAPQQEKANAVSA